ncbi:MAG TPA: hypothetical protein VFS16_12295, partial [Acidimicrobiia bacterium]|nr:hypothetical protein [Acidimicrobiia bacterium]
HTATAFYLPLAAALLAPGDAAARITAALGSAAAVAFAAWLVLGPAPLLRRGLLRPFVPADRGSDPAIALPLVLAGAATMVAGAAAAAGVATAGVVYLAGAVLGTVREDGEGGAPGGVPRTLGVLRDVSAAGAGLALGLLVPAGKLPGAVAGGVVLAALTGVGKLATGWWAAGGIRTADGPVGPAGRLRAGVALVPRGELAVALGLLAALSAPGRGPGPALAALAAVVVVATAAAPALVRLGGRPGWYRWARPVPAAARPEPPGAG